MKYSILFRVPETQLGKADVEFAVKVDKNVLGRMLVSKGNLVWVPAQKRHGFILRWELFQELAVQYGQYDGKSQKRKEENEKLSLTTKDIGDRKLTSGKHLPGKKIGRGIRTQRKEYILPILEVLRGAGGSAKDKVALKRVKGIMSSTLSLIDYEPSPDAKNAMRWEVTAQRARRYMVHIGLLKDNSPRGIWEISEEGVAYLESHSQE